jgi:hypothetical protein
MRMHSTNSARPFGVVTRPTHQNTTSDQAMYEAVAHRIIDLGEPGFDVCDKADDPNRPLLARALCGLAAAAAMMLVAGHRAAT